MGKVPLELEDAIAMLDGFRRLFVESGLAFFETDAAGKVTSWNAHAAQALGAANSEAVGKPLEELVARGHRKRASHLTAHAQRRPGEPRLGSVRLGAREGTALDGKETTFRFTAFYNSAGSILGTIGLAEPHLAGSRQHQEQPPLPMAVGGVVAWRESFHSTAAMPPMFELSQTSKDEDGEIAQQVDVFGKTFAEVVEQTVRTASPIAGKNEGPQPFEADVVPFETEDGATQYFSVRGVSITGPQMPFGGSIGLAQGYAIDVTALHQSMQEMDKWHDRWRLLSHLIYDFILLVDITEYRVVRSWKDQGVFGESMEGRPLFHFVNTSDHARTMDSFSAALLAANGTRSQQFFFWHRVSKRRLTAECTLVSDPGDPSVIFLGAKLTPNAIDNRRDSGGTSSSNAAWMPFQQDVAPPATATLAGDGSNSSRCGGVRLTAETLGLAPALHASTALALQTPHRRDYNSQPMVQEMTQHMPVPGTYGGLGTPLICVQGGVMTSAVQMLQPPLSVQSEPRQMPPPLRAQLVLRGGMGEELWRSAVQSFGKHVVAADLLTQQGLQSVNMPSHFAETVSPSSHVLFVVSYTCNEPLQVASISGTTLQSLQMHCAPHGPLTMILSPVEDSDDAFETVPAS